MADNNTAYTPHLTLEPDAVPAAPGAAAAVASAAATVPSPAAPEALDMSQLSEAEQKAVNDFSAKIDVSDSNAILQYGAAAQKNIAEFSGSTLETVRTKDLGEVGNMLSSLVVELKGFNYSEEEKKGLKGFFKRTANQLSVLKAQYDKAEVNVDKISGLLEQHQVTLLKDVAMLDKMYEMNLAYFKELAMYILAGKKRLTEIRATALAELYKKAQNSGLPEDAQAANDLAEKCNRFEKKIHDLELTRMISIQMSPQIRLIQNNDSLMIEKIQTSIVNTIPLWKSQMILALGMYHSQQAMAAQREVTDITNQLLRKNAEALKTGSIEIAKESERGIVDLETLKATNALLIETLESVRQIQADGSAKRREAEVELGRIEGELKKKLIEMKG